MPAGMSGMYSGFTRPVMDPTTGTWSLPGTPTNPTATTPGPGQQSDGGSGGSTRVSTSNGNSAMTRSLMYPFGFGPSSSGPSGVNDPMLSQEVTEMVLRGGFGVMGPSGTGGAGANPPVGFFGSGDNGMFGFDSPMADGSRGQGDQGGQQMFGMTDAAAGAGAGVGGGAFADLMQGLIGQGGAGTTNGNGNGMGDTGGSRDGGAGHTPSRVGSGQGTAQTELEDMMKMWSSVPDGFEYVPLLKVFCVSRWLEADSVVCSCTEGWRTGIRI